ncbi:MAG: OmpA family protein [Deltaproteobacteria bacterium]|nr:OmpA family protein [Deltaproteobacteria bacterium]
MKNHAIHNTHQTARIAVSRKSIVLFLGLGVFALFTGCSGDKPKPVEPKPAQAEAPASKPNQAEFPANQAKCKVEGQGNSIVVFFDLNSSDVRGEFLGDIKMVAAAVKAKPGYTLRVNGHASKEGSDSYNKALGKRRAQAVSQVLQDGGVDASKITVKSFGKSKPCSKGAAPEDNRRVVIIWEKAGK